jgi:PEP-CTERM motif
MRTRRRFGVLVLGLAALALLVGCTGQAKADIINWNTWSSSSTGSMTVGSTPVTVTFSTTNTHADLPNFPSYTPTTTWADGVVVNNAPVSSNGIMQLVGGTSALNTLSFSTPLKNPVIAILSLGQAGVPASFVFDETPVFIAGGPSAEFGGKAIVVSGNTVSGNEGSGTVEFLGTFSSITWTNPQFEFYYGFNVGSAALPPPPPPPSVPEPSSLALLSLGGLALAGWRRWKKRATA